MTAPREVIFEKVRQWVQYADEDLQLGTHAITMSGPCPYRLVAYHAQQCAEKYLKAYLVFREVDFPFTHNISSLLEICEPHAKWTTALTEAERLTSYAITARYPGVEHEVTENDARQALAMATKVRDYIREDLEDKGIVL